MLEITKVELQQLEGNKDRTLQLLLKKAILKDMVEKKYTEQETAILKELKENTEIEFYLNCISKKDIQIEQHELLEVYKNNLEALKDKNISEVFPQLQQAIVNQKLREEKIKTINQIIEKHKLNDLMKKYSKETEVKEAK